MAADAWARVCCATVQSGAALASRDGDLAVGGQVVPLRGAVAALRCHVRVPRAEAWEKDALSVFSYVIELAVKASVSRHPGNVKGTYHSKSICLHSQFLTIFTFAFS